MSASATLQGCLDCGRLQAAHALAPGEALSCVDCRTELERTGGRSIRAAFAVSAATFLMLAPAAGFPFMRTWVLGDSRTSHLASSVTAMLRDGWPEIAVPIALFVLILPFLRYGLLTVVLGSLLVGRRPTWLGPAFRIANALQPWAMVEVFLVAFMVAYGRLHASVVVEIGLGGQCFIAAGMLALFTRATLDKAQVWRAIGPEDPTVRQAPPDALTCTGCELTRPATEEGCKCPRCGTALRRRRPEAAMRTLALIIAGALLYLPANLYALATLPIGLESLKYTVLEGVIDLANAKLPGLALIVFTASFAIPIAKLAGLSWCVGSVLRRSDAHLRGKTRTYRFVEEVGRWSMIDPFVIACFAPVMNYNALIAARAEAGAPFFTGVVVLTMLGSRSFDPRLMWDAAGRRA